MEKTGITRVRNILNKIDPKKMNKMNLENTAKALGIVGSVASAGATGAYAFEKLKHKIQNEPRRKAILEDLQMNDPIIKEADPEDVIRYYGTMYNVAPELSMDKNAVKEFLQNAIKFGRVDIQAIKTLADTEKTVKGNKEADSVLGNIKGKR